MTHVNPRLGILDDLFNLCLPNQCLARLELAVAVQDQYGHPSRIFILSVFAFPDIILAAVQSNRNGRSALKLFRGMRSPLSDSARHYMQGRLGVVAVAHLLTGDTEVVTQADVQPRQLKREARLFQS